MSNAASIVGASLQGEFEEIRSFRLAVAKYSLEHGIPYKVETSKPDEYKAVFLLPMGTHRMSRDVYALSRFLLTSYPPKRRSV
jgi:hypothetical protein